jgi:rhodanese-related sulfurtransferase
MTALIVIGPTNIALAETISVLRATLVEPNQRTGEVSTDELRRILAEGNAVVLDSRPRAEYVAGHIPAAQNVDAPPAQAVGIVERLVNGDKRTALVLYCNGPFCQASRRLADQLLDAGFTNVRRYQLGMPIWRALGGPTVIELEGIVRILNVDRTAVFFDARSAREFGTGSLPSAQNVPAEHVASEGLQKASAGQLPHDDFNTRVVVFGRDAAQARALADAFSRSPWHNVMYFPGAFEALRSAIK